MRLKRVHWLAVPPILLITLLVLESAYRRRAAEAYERLLQRVDDAHPEAPVFLGELRRFGEPVDRLEFSLVEDFWEGVLLRAGRPLDRHSRLKLDPGAPDALTRPSAYASIRLERPQHIFLWSPRRMDYVLWEYDPECRRSECPAFHPEGSSELAVDRRP